MDSARNVNRDPRRRLPSIDRLVPAILRVDGQLPEWAAKAAARELVERVRKDPESPPVSRLDDSADLLDALAVEGAARAAALAAIRPLPVVNATGVVLHTNLGRAPLAPGAAEAARRAADGYSDLELDLETGRRGQRSGALGRKLCLLTGAEAAHVTNNCAAALLLALNTLALGREVIVSRGELVEIGGAFRVPSIMERAGVKLVEVGTTNRTHLRDYADAIGPETALLLKVHQSNFAQTGFVAEVALGELAALGREHGLPVVEDLGSATVIDLTERGLPAETNAGARLELGADVVCFSGDKLLGGPQAGVLVGRHEAIDAMRQNPLARALRVDKMTLAALDWTVDRLLSGRGVSEIPVLAQLLADPAELERRAGALAKQLAGVVDRADGTLVLRIGATRGAVGGGSLPDVELPGFGVAIRSKRGAEWLAGALRRAPLPVLARIRDDEVWLDVRTLRDEDFAAIETALHAAIDAHID